MKQRYLTLLLVLVAAGCSGAGEPEEVVAMIQAGSQVKLHYTLTVDGEEIDSSTGGDPLRFVQGSGEIIAGLDEQLLGLEAGETKRCVITPDKGYGEHDPAALQAFPRDQIPNAGTMKVGDKISGEVQGRPFVATIHTIGDQEITLDLNHPLAGKTLNFDVEVVEVSDPPVTPEF